MLKSDAEARERNRELNAWGESVPLNDPQRAALAQLWESYQVKSPPRLDPLIELSTDDMKYLLLICSEGFRPDKFGRNPELRLSQFMSLLDMGYTADQAALIVGMTFNAIGPGACTDFTNQPSAETTENALLELRAMYRDQVDNIVLSQIKERFKGTKYNELVQEHVRKTEKEQLEMAIRGCVLALSDIEQEVAEILIDRYNERGYDWSFWRRDTAEILDEICAAFTSLLAERSCSAEDRIQFNLFQLITLNFAQMATEQKDLRKFAGIRKGVIFS